MDPDPSINRKKKKNLDFYYFLTFFDFLSFKTRVSDPDPDPDWIRIQSGQWIRIRIRIRNPDPDPGGQKWPTKVEKIHVLKCWMASFVSCRLLLKIGHTLWRPMNRWIAVFERKKKFNFFSAVIFFQFLVIKALDPYWIRIRIRIGLQPQPLDPDPDKMNTDPKHCSRLM